MHSDEDTDLLGDLLPRAYRATPLQAATVRSQRMKLCFCERISLLDEVRSFRSGERQERPVFYVIGAMRLLLRPPE